jgi:hypothetical protein
MITITKGDDRSINLYLTLSGNSRPYDLTGWTNISVFFKKQFGGLLEKNSSSYNTFAYALYDGVTYTAKTSGTTGNSILLTFSGSQTIQQVVDAWNLANPSNQVGHDSEDGSIIPPAGNVDLEHGQVNLIDVTVVSEVLGHIRVRLHDYDTVQLLAGRSLSFKAVIDKGAPPEGERRKVIFANALEVVEDNI